MCVSGCIYELLFASMCRLENNLRYHSLENFHLFLETWSFSGLKVHQVPGLPDWKPQGILCLCLPIANANIISTCCLNLCEGSGGLNQGPHSCWPSSSLTEPLMNPGHYLKVTTTLCWEPLTFLSLILMYFMLFTQPAKKHFISYSPTNCTLVHIVHILCVLSVFFPP